MESSTNMQASSDNLMSATKWMFGLMYCFLMLAGVICAISGVVLGIVFLDESSVMAVICFLFAAGILGYCIFNIYQIRKIRRTTQQVMEVVAMECSTKEDFTQQLKDKVAQEISLKVSEYGVGYIFDMLLDSIRQELLLTLFGLPGIVLMFGIIILAASRETIGLIFGILLTVFGVFNICIGLPTYFTTMRSIETALEEIKAKMIKHVQEEAEPYAKRAVNTCVVM